MTPGESLRPRLRLVEAQPFEQDGRAFFLLRDPAQISDQAVLVPQELGPLLVLCDGTRTLEELRAAAAVRFGLQVPETLVRQLVGILDEALLLENGRYARVVAAALAEYRQAPCRVPALAGGAYPDDPDALRSLLDGYAATLDAGPEAPDAIRGLICPHIDYPRGGAVYAGVWSPVAAAVRDADLAILLGTDHHGAENDFTLTRQHYSTPLGLLPTDREVVDAVAAAVGEEAAFAGELRHRGEHSIELAAVWLRHRRGEQPLPTVPILCGPLSRFTHGDADPETDESLNTFLSTLRRVLAGRRALVIAAADLSHVGPAFDGPPLDARGRAELTAADDLLLQRVCAGDAGGFLAAIRRERNRFNVCGVSPIYLLLRLLSPTRGTLTGYALCPADEQNTSVVSIGGVVLQ